MFIKILLKLPSTLKAISSTDYLYLCRLAASFNKNMNGKTTRWASPKALTFSRYIKRYSPLDIA
jgi:hypothetical protein